MQKRAITMQQPDATMAPALPPVVPMLPHVITMQLQHATTVAVRFPAATTWPLATTMQQPVVWPLELAPILILRTTARAIV
jgi:hypothetical protein